MSNVHTRRRMLRENHRIADFSDSESEPDVEVQQAVRRWGTRGVTGVAAAAAAAAASASASASDEKKKKKKKKRLPPQETIDQLWANFSQKRFSKATTVLPFAPVAPSPLSNRANELLSLGYERAAEECRRKVRKIIQECRRVNMRYRDPGWDIDWDLKMGKGHCLNSLGRETFDVSMKNMLRISASVPKAVKRVHEIFEKPTFMANVCGSDVKQGSLGNCWFISCVSGLANVPGALQRSCVEYDTKIGIYGFVLYRDGEWIYSIIDDKLYLTSPSWDSPSFQRDLLSQIDQDDIERVYRKTYQTGSKALFFAQNKDQNETWLPLMEKAYAKAHGDYDSLTGGWIGEGLEDITGGVTTELLMSDIFDTDAFWDNELSRVNQEFLFGCTTGLLDGGYGNRGGITEGHAYNIVEARTLKNGTRLVKLRNPWGKVKAGTWEGAWSDGSKEWTTEAKEEVGHTFGSDSTFWIAYEDFLLKFQNVDRTRLFRDPDWRCCQRWIGVDAPWKTSYNEKFHIKLTRASPLVLVLSQLDARYFQGLVGQYYFRLHFRLHEQDRPGAEDYIVRSHGNYLMDRSVSVELPLLEPGNYSVFMSVVAERAAKSLSVEDVVKRELKDRVENEKLAQVGQAYDLAHSKAAAHLDELAKLRKKSDWAKASEVRKKERRKTWADRHLLRDIQRRQHKKNDAKADRLAAAKRGEKRGDKEEKEKGAANNEKREEKDNDEKKEIKEEKREEEKKEEKEEKKDEKKDIKDTDKATVETALQAAAEAVTASATSSAGIAITTASSSGTSTPQKTPPASPSEPPADPTMEPVATGPRLEKLVDGVKADGDNKQNEPKVITIKKDEAEARVKTHEPRIMRHPKDGAPPPPPPVDDDVDDSSDSPIEDWEEWYSSDDMTTQAIRNAAAAAAKAGVADDDDSEDENTPTPWNALCIMGIRVYSKDEHLELRVVLEGGDLSEGGMGERGEQDLDNAQANAGGERIRKDNGMCTDREDIDIETERDEVLKKEEKKKKDKERVEKEKDQMEKQGMEQAEQVEKMEDKADKKKEEDKAQPDVVEQTQEKGAEANNGPIEAGEVANDTSSDVSKDKLEGDKDTAKDAEESPVDDGLATYSTIVQKDGEDYEKASAPVKPEACMPGAFEVDNTMMWG